MVSESELTGFNGYLVDESTKQGQVWRRIGGENSSCGLHTRHCQVPSTIIVYSFCKWKRRWKDGKQKRSSDVQMTESHRSRRHRSSPRRETSPKTAQKHKGATSSTQGGRMRTWWGTLLRSCGPLRGHKHPLGDFWRLFSGAAFVSCTWDFASNMNPHGNAQAVAQVDAHILAKSPLPRHYLCHRPQPKCLERKYRREKHKWFCADDDTYIKKKKKQGNPSNWN